MITPDPNGAGNVSAITVEPSQETSYLSQFQYVEHTLICPTETQDDVVQGQD